MDYHISHSKLYRQLIFKCASFSVRRLFFAHSVQIDLGWKALNSQTRQWCDQETELESVSQTEDEDQLSACSGSR